MEPTKGCQKCDGHSTFGGSTDTLDELAGCHTRLAINPTLTICYQRVVIHASLDIGFRGEKVVICPVAFRQLKLYLLKSTSKVWMHAYE